MVIPSSRPESSGRIGVFGTVWMIGWVAIVLLALTQGLTWGAAAIYVLLAGIAGGIGWGLAQRKSPTAVFDVTLLKIPLVTPACLAAGLFGASDSSFLLLVTYYTQTPAAAGYGLGVDALGTGLLMLPFALMMFLGGKAAERVVRKGHTRLVLIVGAAVSAVGLGWLAVEHSAAWHYLVGAALVGAGSRVGYSGAFAVPQLVVPEEKAGMAAGMPGTTMAIGFAFGSAVITGLLTAATIPGTSTPREYLFTIGYTITLAFALVILAVTLLSRLRHRGEPLAVPAEA
jgi:MFS family permease